MGLEGLKNSNVICSILESAISLINDAKGMLMRNFCTEVGLCNGDTGTVIHVVFKNDQRSLICL